MEITTKSATESQALGEKIGAALKGGEIIALSGDLGAGKTTFVQGVAKGLGVSAHLISPTFIIMRTYDAGEKTLYHIDLYRLEQNADQEIVNLGIPYLWEEQSNICIIEWSERLSSLPGSAIKIAIENSSSETRVFSFTNLPEYIQKILL